MIRQILFLAGLFLCMPQGGKSQSIDELLQQIERNLSLIHISEPTRP